MNGSVGTFFSFFFLLLFHDVHAFYYNRERKIKEETYSQSGVLVKVNL